MARIRECICIVIHPCCLHVARSGFSPVKRLLSMRLVAFFTVYCCSWSLSRSFGYKQLAKRVRRLVSAPCCCCWFLSRLLWYMQFANKIHRKVVVSDHGWLSSLWPLADGYAMSPPSIGAAATRICSSVQYLPDGQLQPPGAGTSFTCFRTSNHYKLCQCGSQAHGFSFCFMCLPLANQKAVWVRKVPAWQQSTRGAQAQDSIARAMWLPAMYFHP